MIDLNEVSDDELLAQYVQAVYDDKYLLNKDQPHLPALLAGGANPLVTRDQALRLIKLHLFYGIQPSVVISTELFVAMTERIRVLEEKAWIRDLP